MILEKKDPKIQGPINDRNNEQELEDFQKFCKENIPVVENIDMTSAQIADCEAMSKQWEMDISKKKIMAEMKFTIGFADHINKTIFKFIETKAEEYPSLKGTARRVGVVLKKFLSNHFIKMNGRLQKTYDFLTHDKTDLELKELWSRFQSSVKRWEVEKGDASSLVLEMKQFVRSLLGAWPADLHMDDEDLILQLAFFVSIPTGITLTTSKWERYLEYIRDYEPDFLIEKIREWLRTEKFWIVDRFL